jgi:hypothetical protein
MSAAASSANHNLSKFIWMLYNLSQNSKKFNLRLRAVHQEYLLVDKFVHFKIKQTTFYL